MNIELSDYIKQIEIDDVFVGSPETRVIYFAAPVEMLDNKYSDAAAAIIRMEFPIHNFSLETAEFCISPVKYDDYERRDITYDWHTATFSTNDICNLVEIANEHFQLLVDTGKKRLHDIINASESNNLTLEQQKEFEKKCFYERAYIKEKEGLLIQIPEEYER